MGDLAWKQISQATAMNYHGGTEEAVVIEPERGLLGVICGVGPQGCGDVPLKEVQACLRDSLQHHTDTVAAVGKSLQMATDRFIHREEEPTFIYAYLSLACLQGDQLHTFHIGRSAAFRYRAREVRPEESKLIRLTRNDILEGEGDEGKIWNVSLKALGLKESDVESNTSRCMSGDQIVFLSTGAAAALSEEDIVHALALANPALELVNTAIARMEKIAATVVVAGV